MRKINNHIKTKQKALNDIKLLILSRKINKEYKIKYISLNNRQKRELYKQIIGHSYPINFNYKYALITSFLIILCISPIAVYAEHSQPGQSFYPIKKALQTVRLWLQPSYIKDVVKDRKNETKKLIQKNASPDTVQEAKNDYNISVQKAINDGYKNQIQQDIDPELIENSTTKFVAPSENLNNYMNEQDSTKPQQNQQQTQQNLLNSQTHQP
jgi:hypothetical protein